MVIVVSVGTVSEVSVVIVVRVGTVSEVIVVSE